jgi:hypothetical protein
VAPQDFSTASTHHGVPLDTASHIAARALRLLALASAAALLYACAGAPVQEMSDARQTLAAAEQAQAEKSAPAEMESARHYLDAAQAALDAGDYSTAREDALKARQAALRALGISQGQDVSGHSPP